MRIRLELEDYKFCNTFNRDTFNRYMSVRWLIVHVGGKPFSVCREIINPIFNDQRHIEAIDEHLVGKMEIMLKQILEDACGAIKPGTEILQKEQ